MRFHVFYFTLHPSASYAITQKCEMGNARRHWYISNLPCGECARDWVLDSLRRSWFGQSWTLLWFMTFPIRADNEAREGLGTRLGLQHYVHKSQISSVRRSSLILHFFSCNRTDHQSDSFLPERRLEGLYSKWNIVEKDKFTWIYSNVPTSPRTGPGKQLIKAVKHLVFVPISL